MEHGGAEWTSYGVLALVLLGLAAALWRSGFLARLMRLIEETLLGNWQLALLGATAIALSLASAYTTFDGLRSFTSAPLLSVLVAFGIQGVLLIVSWLIGESFATGMSQRTAPRDAHAGARNGRERALGLSLGALLVALVFCWALSRYEAIAFESGAGDALRVRIDWPRLADTTLTFLMVLALVGLVGLAFRFGGDLAQPYVQSLRLIARNAVLWVMLLACMCASVFFSFDSHFNAIFPAGQRQRAAEVRTLNQVAAVIADIGEHTRKVRAAEASRLSETDGWRSYDVQLSTLVATTRDVQPEITARLVARLEERQRGIGEQQERIAGAERSQSALLRKRDGLEAELQRLETSMGALEAELAKAQSAYDETRQAIAAKEIEASAEDGGVDGSLKRGKGPAWRQRMAEAEELQRKLKIVDEARLKEAQGRRDAASARIVGLKREVATIVAEAAKYKGAIFAAAQRINAAQEGDAGAATRIDPDRMLEALERARTAFRQRPEPAHLAAVQARCQSLLEALSGVTEAREKVRGVDCDPKAVAEAAARVFALDAGLRAFEAGCVGGSKLPQSAGTDELLGFGRKCLQDSGLTSRDTTDFGVRLQAIEMNRDDKAHRFVVTWNAVLDGNRLAYLALVLAIGVDSLVFMAGLFGAAASRSPLSEVPSPKARSAEQLEAIVRAALGEEPLTNADLVLGAMRPAPGDDERSEIDLAGYDEVRTERIRKVLVAGRSIGAVERVAGPPNSERYLVRPELIEFLSVEASSAREAARSRSDRLRLAEIVGVALEPDRPGNAAIVLRHAEPIEPRRGLVASIDLAAVAKEKDRRLVQNLLGAGMTLGAATPQSSQGGIRRLTKAQPAASGSIYLLRADLFETLLHYRVSAASAPVHRSAQPIVLTAVPSPSAEYASFENVAAPASSDCLLIDGRTVDTADGDDLGRHFQEAMTNEVTAKAKAAAAEVARSPGRRRDIRAALERIARDSVSALERAERGLEREHKNDQQVLALLAETSRRIAARIPALLPGVLEDLMEEAEMSGDDDLLSQLRRLRDATASSD